MKNGGGVANDVENQRGGIGNDATANNSAAYVEICAAETRACVMKKHREEPYCSAIRDDAYRCRMFVFFL